MDKIYRRPTQLSNTPKKKKDERSRKRNTCLNFRMTQTERELIEARIAVTGLEKADFFIESCLYQKILVKGNIKSFTQIKNQMAQIAEAINKNPNLEELEPAQAEILKTILEIIDRRFTKEENDGSKII
ncbi:MAG: hypothetical protein K6E75_13715 [Lachnospiraceae bacterium]|nr:hypothetical protein [Lachnospiraceae bacterium]